MSPPELQAISQTGLHYASDQFDRERYRRIEAISSEIRCIRLSASVINFALNQAGENQPSILSQKSFLVSSNNSISLE